MSKNTPILLGDHLNSFINEQIKTGRFSSASEVVRCALRLFEEQELRKTELINALVEGEESGFVEDFDKGAFLAKMHQKVTK